MKPGFHVFYSVWLALVFAIEGRAAPLQWESFPGYRRARLSYSTNGIDGFTLMPNASLGIAWTNYVSSRRVAERQNLMNGAGVALGDYDGDGLCDIYLCNKEGSNALYRNLGNWRFEDVTARAGVGCTNQSSTGAVFADVNGDGKLDLLVNSFAGPNACFLNQGDGTFRNVTESGGLISKGGTTSLALGDLNGDGHLDLYVAYFGMEAILRDGGSYSVREMNGKPVVSGRYAKRLKIEGGQIFELGEPDILYLNDGRGRFAPVNWTDAFRDEDDQPMKPPFDFGLAVQIRDINGDGLPDIYVCNDFQTPDRLWLNKGNGHFRAIDRLALRTMSYASMGVDFADLDRDGRLDFFTVEMLSPSHVRHLSQASPKTFSPRKIGSIDDREEVTRNALFWNRGDGTYAEIAYYSGLAASDWSWTPIFMDVDLDGYEDVLISNGHMHDVNNRDVMAITAKTAGSRSNLFQYPALSTPNAAYRNRGGLRFENVGRAWGFNSTNISHGMALGDLDNDGDQDVVVNCLNAPPLIYRNNATKGRVAVRLKGLGSNSQGIGGKITLRGGPVDQTQEVICGGRFLSGDDPIRVFATGKAAGAMRLEVKWRSGKESIVENVRANFYYEIDESGAGEARPTLAIAPTSPCFVDVSGALSHQHHEELFDDFARQPLLPKRLSQLGPGIAWFDLDGDGHEDIVIGSGRGGLIQAYKGDGKGGFTGFASGDLKNPMMDDAMGLAVFQNARKPILLSGRANYESGTNTPALVSYEFRDGGFAFAQSLPGIGSSPGPIALADVDGDGALDLFIGGRLKAGEYPVPAGSRLYRNDKGRFVEDPRNAALFEHVGLVSGAVFSDLDGDGNPDLVLACEWGPLKVYHNEHGLFHEVTAEMGLGKLTGLWTSVAAGDFDGDGRMDLVAGNWGWNTFYNSEQAGPWELYYGDFSGDGRTQILEAFMSSELGKPAPWRDMQMVGTAIPWVRDQYQTHASYARAGIVEILGTRFARAKKLQVATLASTVFLNRGDHFQAVPLPSQAQWSPCFGINAADLDGDGKEDIFMAQNFFATRDEDARLDAGCGLWLKGRGDGTFSEVSVVESGIKIYGEQRGSALCDFDEDGRVDIAVAQNGAATKLFRNAKARPGLRIRLLGPAGNPNGVGAIIRLSTQNWKGPAREIHAGSGYWSQDSAIQVMSVEPNGIPARISIQWRGGHSTSMDIPNGAREISANITGELKVIR